MQKKEETMLTFTQKGTRLQLVKILEPIIQIKHDQNFKPYETGDIYYRLKYEVRLNRKKVSKSSSEYNERKVFATYCQKIVLQIKIY